MTGTVPTPLAPLVQRFFTKRLVSQLGASANTIKSYRDTFKLLLDFAEAWCAKTSWDMDVADIDADLVGSFLDHLESERQQQREEPQCPPRRHPFLLQSCRRQRTPGPPPLPEDPATADKFP